jgi:hypothetical protein
MLLRVEWWMGGSRKGVVEWWSGGVVEWWSGGVVGVQGRAGLLLLSAGERLESAVPWGEWTAGVFWADGASRDVTKFTNNPGYGFWASLTQVWTSNLPEARTGISETRLRTLGIQRAGTPISRRR